MSRRKHREDQPLLGENSDDDSPSYSDSGLRNGALSGRNEPLQDVVGSHSVNDSDAGKDVERPAGYGSGATKVYKRRWYILLLFSLFSCTFSTVWNCWGPIASSAEAAFGWEFNDIALLTNLGPIAYMLTGFIFPWFLQEKGLRGTALVCAFLSGIGNTLRAITSDPHTATILIYIGQGLNGFIGPFAMAAIPQVSSVWFPPDERVTATSISNSFCIFGYAFSFLIGPALVSDVNVTHTSNPNKSRDLFPNPFDIHLPDENSTMLHSVIGDQESNSSVVETARSQIMRYMYIECGWSWLLFFAFLIYFPKHPPLPPGLSAVATRDSYWSGLWSLKGKFGFLMVAFTYGISTGVTAGWASVLSTLLDPYGIDQTDAGWIGFSSITGACIISLILCRFANHFIRHIKIFILSMLALGTAALLIFALMTVDVIPLYDGLLYFCIISGFTLTNGAIPLLFELACELAYPTSESAANGFLTFLNNFFCLIFLLFSTVLSGTSWMNWAVMGCCFICLPMMIILKPKMNRLDLDEGMEIFIPVPDDSNSESDDSNKNLPM